MVSVNKVEGVKDSRGYETISDADLRCQWNGTCNTSHVVDRFPLHTCIRVFLELLPKEDYLRRKNLSETDVRR